MTTNQNAMTIFEPRNVQTLAQLAPQSYSDNQLSHLRCLQAGQSLLDRIKELGMTDDLDIEVAKYIEKSKATLRKMNSRRAPVTQLFDQIRKAYTSMENDVDPTKISSIPGQLQAARNEYARRRHQAEEQRRLQEMERIARDNAIAQYRAAVEDDFSSQFNAAVNQAVNQLTGLDSQLTIVNYQTTLDTLKHFNCQLPSDWLSQTVSSVPYPAALTPAECQSVQSSVMASLANRFSAQYIFDVQSTRDDILDRLPSKLKELERIAKASADEAARLKAEMQAKEQAEAARKEAERIERDKQQAAASALASQKQEMDSLFALPTATATYQPKTQVKKKVVIDTPDDIMAIVAFWWSQEGCKLSLEDLCKQFKKQITFANAAANSKDNPIFITNVRYEDEVKAK